MKDDTWDYTISSKRSLFDIKLRELIRYRDLVLMFFIRDFTTAYKQTIMGPIWYILSPLCHTVVYAFVFGNLAKVGTGGVPFLLFYYGGTMLWNYFSECLNSGANIFINNAGVFGKVYFPRLAVPIATTLGLMSKMVIQFATLMAFLVYFCITGNSVHPTPFALLFPVIAIWLGALGTGAGMVISSLTTKYRDLNHLLALGISLAMYVTPVVYPLSEVPKRFMFFFYINPVSAPIELFRVWFYGSGYVPPTMLLSSICVTVVILTGGLMLFNKTEQTSMDVI